MSKDVVILRGVSGSGKSTVAEMLCQIPGWVICCADEYFMVDGEYKFDGGKLRRAHEWCFDWFVASLHNPNCRGIVVANTNTRPREMKVYEDEANKHGARVFRWVLENTHGGQNIHGVPEEALVRQEENIRNNLQLR